MLDKDSTLLCTRCNSTLRRCTCPDIDERLMRLGEANGSHSFRWCRECNKHYARCNCERPFWIFSDTSEPMHEANEAQRLEEARGTIKP